MKLQDIFSEILVLTESNLVTEPKANRFHWIRYLKESGLPITVISNHLEGPTIIPDLPGLEVQYFDQKRLIKENRIDGILRNEKALIWNFGSSYNEIVNLAKGFVVAHLTEDYLSEDFITEYDFQFRYQNQLIEIIERANLIITVSGGVTQNTKRFGNISHKIVEIPNSVDYDFFGKNLDLSRKQNQIIYSGAVNDRLDFDLISQIATENSNFMFDFYGAISSNVQNKIPSNHNVAFHGAIDTVALREKLQQATYAFIPFKNLSWLRGSLPLKLMEYFASGLPVLSTPLEQYSTPPEFLKFITSTSEFQKQLQAFENGNIQHLRDCAQNYAKQNSYEQRFDLFLERLNQDISSEILERDEKRLPKALVLYDLNAMHINAVADHVRGFTNFKNIRTYFGDIGEIGQIDLEDFDLVIGHYSIRYCYPESYPKELLSKFKNYSGVLGIFLQDEYDETNLAIDFLVEIQPSFVFTCIPENKIDLIYPLQKLNTTVFTQVLTGFVPTNLENFSKWVPYNKRTIDVGYRGRRLPNRYGRLGFDKWNIGESFREKAEGLQNIKVDIECYEFARIYGDAWIDFLANCKAVLGTESGSNVFDFDGALAKMPEELATIDFEIYEKRFLKNREFNGLMNQISPRIFESVATKSMLVLYEGNYSGVLEPYVHYFPLKRDLSNFDQAINHVKDEDTWRKYVERAHKDLIVSKKYSEMSYYAYIEEQMAVVLEEFLLSKDREIQTSQSRVTRLPKRSRVSIDSVNQFIGTSNSKGPFKLLRFAWRLIPSNIRYWIFPRVLRVIRSLIRES